MFVAVLGSSEKKKACQEQPLLARPCFHFGIKTAKENAEKRWEKEERPEKKHEKKTKEQHIP